ncbi:hypothetical protein SVAN01_01718 [Stagonosporopsis vannaccii]|nr:hypothetical protein SVAN01_01718 [Stagonosporopsis vannaccii]
MVLPILNLPSEIILQILSNLPITPLLRFAQTSQLARNLAYTNLHALSLAIRPTHRARWHSDNISTIQHKPIHPLYAAIQIPQASDFDYATLLTFHSKLFASILHRHACTLQKLELTLWTLSPAIARAVIRLPLLRELRIVLEHTQAIPRAYKALQRREETAAWNVLACAPSWTRSLRALSIQNAGISAEQLLGIVEGATRLRDLRLSSCDMLTNSIWGAGSFGGLQYLGVTDCANVHVNEAAVRVISKIQKLEVLDLHGCNGLDGEVLEQWNRDVWRVPVFVAPRPRGFLKQEFFIEVDPDYMVEPV